MRKKTIEQFAIDLHKVHGDKIKLAADAKYTTTNDPIKVVCGVCGHHWEPEASSLLKGHGCPKCSAQRSKDSFGKKRQPRATEAEKAKARQLRAEGWTYRAISKELDRAVSAIQKCCDPEQLAKHRAYVAAYDIANRESIRDYAKRYAKETPHGRVGLAKGNAMRRGNYRDYDDQGNIIYQEWETYTAEEERELKEIEARLKHVNETNYLGIKWSLEHLLPMSKGGEHKPYNLSITPLLENISKNDKIDPAHIALRNHKIAKLFK